MNGELENIGGQNVDSSMGTDGDTADTFGMGDFFNSASAETHEDTEQIGVLTNSVPQEGLPQAGLPGVEGSTVSTGADALLPQGDSSAQGAEEVGTGDAGTVEQPDTAKTNVEVTPEQDIAALREQYAEAMGKLSQLTMQIQQMQQNPEVKMELPQDPKELSSVDFLQGQNITDFLESPEAFNGLLNKVATISARAGQQAGYEMAMRTIPQVVQQSAQQQYQQQAAIDNFYKKNEDLAPFKQAVGMAALDFYSKNPGANIEQILEGAGKATRQVLRMRGTTTNRVPAQPAVSVSMGGQDRLAQPPQLSPIEQQILDVISAAQ